MENNNRKQQEAEAARARAILGGHPDTVFSSVVMLIRARDAERERAEQLQVQLAGCLTAAEGGTTDPARPGMYGWSMSYAAALGLRLSFEKAEAEVASLRGQLARAVRQTDNQFEMREVAEQRLKAAEGLLRKLWKIGPLPWIAKATQVSGVAVFTAPTFQEWEAVMLAVEAHLAEEPKP